MPGDAEKCSHPSTEPGRSPQIRNGPLGGGTARLRRRFLSARQRQQVPDPGDEDCHGRSRRLVRLVEAEPDDDAAADNRLRLQGTAAPGAGRRPSVRATGQPTREVTDAPLRGARPGPRPDRLPAPARMGGPGFSHGRRITHDRRLPSAAAEIPEALRPSIPKLVKELVAKHGRSRPCAPRGGSRRSPGSGGPKTATRRPSRPSPGALRRRPEDAGHPLLALPGPLREDRGPLPGDLDRRAPADGLDLGPTLPFDELFAAWSPSPTWETTSSGTSSPSWSS